MAVKRKRSDSDSPASVSSSFSLFSRTSTSPTPCPRPEFCPMDTDSTYSSRFSNPSESEWFTSFGGLNSRTRKRVRDSRPDEREIHESTLQKLFSAQRHLPASNTPTPEPMNFTLTPTPSAAEISVVPIPQQKTTLHAFWKLPKQPSQRVFSVTVESAMDVDEKCEHCLGRLKSSDDGAMDIDMDDGVACARCARAVCDECAVRGERRLCLTCASMR